MSKYIKNDLGYDILIKLKDEERLGEYTNYVFPCLTRYQDTGNLYHSGVTALEDSDFNKLKENTQFVRLLAKGELKLTDKSAMTESANELEDAKAELEKVKAENEQLRKEAAGLDNNGMSEENAKLLAENADMKARLEAFEKQAKADKKAENKPSDTKAGDGAGGF